MSDTTNTERDTCPCCGFDPCRHQKSNPAAPTIDFRVNNQGSIYILTPVSPGAQEWADEHLPADAQRWGPNGIVIEHRYIGDIIEALESEGFVGRLI